ncbi:MAG: hypothetical protein CVU56_27780 [Deltaproteobacteria bacterium HGW-Deltaproteobacteria-14]|nr:MAG: hypothetical protein CVU56_27780 [Deltaproteobacteria bacterium HGW-Deltaproteobacteria-14]
MVGEIARYALQRRLAIPLDSLRYFANQPGGTGPKDIVLSAKSPALGVGATLDAMGTMVRVDANVYVDHVHAGPGELRVTIRVKDLKASVLNNLDGNLAKLLKSGVLNLAKPASLLSMMGGKKPALIVEAKDDMFVLDLMQVKSLARDSRLQKALATLSPVLAVSDVRTEGDTLLLALKASPKGFREALAAIRS